MSPVGHLGCSSSSSLVAVGWSPCRKFHWCDLLVEALLCVCVGWMGGEGVGGVEGLVAFLDGCDAPLFYLQTDRYANFFFFFFFFFSSPFSPFSLLPSPFSFLSFPSPCSFLCRGGGHREGFFATRVCFLVVIEICGSHCLPSSLLARTEDHRPIVCDKVTYVR